MCDYKNKVPKMLTGKSKKKRRRSSSVAAYSSKKYNRRKSYKQQVPAAQLGGMIRWHSELIEAVHRRHHWLLSVKKLAVWILLSKIFLHCFPEDSQRMLGIQQEVFPQFFSHSCWHIVLCVRFDAQNLFWRCHYRCSPSCHSWSQHT